MQSLKNRLILLLVRVSKLFNMQTWQKASHDAPRILIVTTTGLGDTLWGTPAIEAVKTTYPKAFLGVLTSELGAHILSDNPHIDLMLTIKHAPLWQLFSLWKKLKEGRFDTVIIFHLSQRATLPLCYFAKPSHIIGTLGINKGLDTLLTLPLPQEPEHEIQRRLTLISHIGVTEACPQLKIYLKEEHHLHAKKLLTPLTSLRGPIIALHPGAKDRFKQWSPEAFIALGKRLQHTLHAHIVLTGGPEEAAMTAHIAAALSHPLNLAGKLSIKQLAALFGQIDLLVTNDTGPMHLAFAMHTKTVALFSPTDPERCGPFHQNNVKILYKSKTCAPCLGKRCRDAFCMLQHAPDEVFQHVYDLLLAKTP